MKLLPATHRIRALLCKESCQILRDKWSLAVAILLPLFLLLLFGYAMSMDIRNVKLAIVRDRDTGATHELIRRFQASNYFQVTQVATARQAEALIDSHQCDAALYLPENFERRLRRGDAELLVTVNAINANQSRLIRSYIEGVVAQFSVAVSGTAPPVQLVPRIWFNEANDSRYYLVPGVMVIIMTLIGALLTSLVMAKEYEKGNLECIFATPVRPMEILIAKAVNNFFIGIIGLIISLLAARFLFHVPLHGSLWILLGVSSIYLSVTLGLGLLISSMAKNQFIACQLTLLFTFLPAYMLSGFLYDIENMPAPVRMITYLVPARYYVEFMQTIFLAGNIWPVILKDAAALSVFAFLFLHLARVKTPKSVE